MTLGSGVHGGVVPAVRHVSYSQHVVQFDRRPLQWQRACLDRLCPFFLGDGSYRMLDILGRMFSLRSKGRSGRIVL
jgi:hypothetical protein